MSVAASAGQMIIHIGAPKTGSTYLQRRLRVDPQHLRNNGIYVPVHPLVARMAGNAKLLATVFLGRPTPSFVRAFPNIEVASHKPSEILADLLCDWRRDEEAVVLSAENFRPAHAARLRDLLGPEIDPVPVLFVRRQDAWMESYFNQLTKTRDIAESLPSFIEKVCSGEDDRFCTPDWFAHYQAWCRAFGRCRVAFYEEARGDLFSAFLETAGLPDVIGLTEIDREQVSLSAYQLAYLLELDRDLPVADFFKHRTACNRAAQAAGTTQKVSFMSQSCRSELLARFQESNRELFKVLGRSPDDGGFKLGDPASPHSALETFRNSDDYLHFKRVCISMLNEAG